MPFNGSGTFISIAAPNYPAIAGQPIYASQFNINLTDIFGGLSTCLTRDGQSTATADLPMGGHKHIGAGAATGAGQYLTWGQTFNATTATALQTGRTINGTYFDGTANITIAASDATKLPLAGGTMTGNIQSSNFYLNLGTPAVLQLVHNGGYIGGYSVGAMNLTGYLQFNAGSDVRLSAETGLILNLCANSTVKLALSSTLADFKSAMRTTPIGAPFSTTLALDASVSNRIIVGTLTGNVTSFTIANAAEGQSLSIRFRQDAVGGRTVSHPSPANIAGSIDPTANNTTYLSLTWNGTDSRWDGIWSQVPI